MVVKFGGNMEISIHAPVKGATSFDEKSQYGNYDFNPRPREGRDANPHLHMLHLLDFNPRPREGSDLHEFGSRDHLQNFNPRPREGSDSA